MMKTLIFVAFGGALGACLRYFIGLAVAFPFGTLAINVFGSFLIGLVWAGFIDKAPNLVPFALVGLLGGFTTFSSFSLDTMRLVQDGRLAAAGTYILASVFLSLLACFMGLWLLKGGTA